MTESSSPLYTALLKALNVEKDSIVASAWGKDYTLGDFDRMTDKEIRHTAYKIKTYNIWLRLLLGVSKIRVWFWRNLDELTAGF